MNVPRPGLHRLAPASRGRELNMLFHRRNKQVVAERTHVLAFPEHFMGGRYHHDWTCVVRESSRVWPLPVPVVNQIRPYWWCSPPRTGRQRMCPASSTARETGASFSKDKCVRTSL